MIALNCEKKISVALGKEILNFGIIHKENETGLVNAAKAERRMPHSLNDRQMQTTITWHSKLLPLRHPGLGYVTAKYQFMLIRIITNYIFHSVCEWTDEAREKSME